MTKRILVVDDEPNILTLLKMNLEINRYEVITAETGNEAIKKALTESPDLILLDLMLPDIDGVTVCQKIRTEPSIRTIPVIMLTAKTEETDMIIGLEVGADDYITKPFSIREVLARIKVLFRRIEELTNVTVGELDNNIQEEIEVYNMKIFPEEFQIKIENELVEVTRMEFKIIKYLLDNRKRVVPRQELVDMLTEKDKKPDEKSVNVHVWNIRKKLAKHCDEYDYIETIRGIGYRMH